MTTMYSYFRQIIKKAASVTHGTALQKADSSYTDSSENKRQQVTPVCGLDNSTFSLNTSKQ